MSIVVGNSQLSTDNDVVNENAFTHCPQLKPNGINRTEAQERRIILKVVRIVYLARSPLSLLYKIIIKLLVWVIRMVVLTS